MKTLRLATRTTDGAVYQSAQLFAGIPAWPAADDAPGIAASFGVEVASLTMLDVPVTPALAATIVAALSGPTVSLPGDAAPRSVIAAPPPSKPTVSALGAALAAAAAAPSDPAKVAAAFLELAKLAPP